MARDLRPMRVEEVEHLTAFGEHPVAIAQALGIEPASLARALYRAGRPDLASQFQYYPHHPCADCKTLVRPKSTRCKPCNARHLHRQRKAQPA